MAALPFLDELDWSTVDAILITHFHLDHAASLTYVMEKVRSPLLRRTGRVGADFPPLLYLCSQTNFKEGKGVVYMSHPTKAVYRYLMSDFVRVSFVSFFTVLFSTL
jgi:cleavage and polyadenylation specificity factor subunit 3